MAGARKRSGKKRKSTQDLTATENSADVSQDFQSEKPDENEVGASAGSRLVKFINRTFTENKSFKHRLGAVEILADSLELMTFSELQPQCISWITHLLKLLETSKGEPSGRALTSFTLSQLLIISSQDSELSRVISLNIIQKIVCFCLSSAQTQSKEVELVSLINLLKICMKYYGANCLSYKNKIETLLLSILLHRDFTSPTLNKVCCICFAHLPSCGGQGSTGNKHIELWSNQMSRLVFTISKLIKLVYQSCGVLMKELSVEEPSGQPLPLVTEESQSTDLVKDACVQLIVYLQLIHYMIAIAVPWTVELPIKELLLVMCQAADVTPDSVIFRKVSADLSTVKSYLPRIHTLLMQLLSAVMKCSGTSLYMYKSSLCNLLRDELQWTGQLQASPDDSNAFRSARLEVYDCLITCVTQPGCHTLITDISDYIISQANKDLNPKFTATNGNDVTQNPAKKSKPSKTFSASKSELRHQSDLSKRLVSKLRLTALDVVSAILSYCSTSLSSSAIRLIYDQMIELTLELQTCLPADLPNKELRQRLYRCLISTIYCYNAEVGPLTHIATSIVDKALTDTCPEVRSLCQSLQLQLTLAIQPRSVPLDQHNSAFLSQSDQSAAAGDDPGVDNSKHHQENILPLGRMSKPSISTNGLKISASFAMESEAVEVNGTEENEAIEESESVYVSYDGSRIQSIGDDTIEDVMVRMIEDKEKRDSVTGSSLSLAGESQLDIQEVKTSSSSLLLANSSDEEVGVVSSITTHETVITEESNDDSAVDGSGQEQVSQKDGEVSQAKSTTGKTAEVQFSESVMEMLNTFVEADSDDDS